MNTIIEYTISRRILFWINDFRSKQNLSLSCSRQENTTGIYKITFLLRFVSLIPFSTPKRIMIPYHIFCMPLNSKMTASVIITLRCHDSRCRFHQATLHHKPNRNLYREPSWVCPFCTVYSFSDHNRNSRNGTFG